MAMAITSLSKPPAICQIAWGEMILFVIDVASHFITLHDKSIPSIARALNRQQTAQVGGIALANLHPR